MPEPPKPAHGAMDGGPNDPRRLRCGCLEVCGSHSVEEIQKMGYPWPPQNAEKPAPEAGTWVTCDRDRIPHRLDPFGWGDVCVNPVPVAAPRAADLSDEEIDKIARGLAEGEPPDHAVKAFIGRGVKAIFDGTEIGNVRCIEILNCDVIITANFIPSDIGQNLVRFGSCVGTVGELRLVFPDKSTNLHEKCRVQSITTIKPFDVATSVFTFSPSGAKI